MKEERIELSQRERERLKVLHEVEQRHWKQREAAERLRHSVRQVRRLLQRVRKEGDRGLLHGRCGAGPRSGRLPRRCSDGSWRRCAVAMPTSAPPWLASIWGAGGWR